jgi:flagellar hook-associated protein 3
MRIATSTLYNEQASSLDNLYSTYQTQGQELSTGKSLNAPSDDPTVIAQDLTVRADNVVQTQLGKNFTDLTNQLTTVDGALSNVTSALQSARNLAVEGASDTLNASQRQDIATQINQILNEVIGFANTQYNGKYVFAGTNVPTSTPLVQGQGSPITSVTTQGNLVQQAQQSPNGTTIGTGVTLQQAFNVNAPDGSPSVFQTLINLRDSLQKGQVVDESQAALNLPGTAIANATPVTSLVTGAAPQIMATPLQYDSTGNQLEINIASGSNSGGANIVITSADTIGSIVAKINAQTATTGVTASFNAQTQRLSLTSSANPPVPFTVTDVPSAGSGTTTGNFVAAFGLTNAASTTSYVSTQLGDIDKVISTTLNARAVVGSTIQSSQTLTTASSSQVNNDTSVQSGLEDTDIAKVTSEFTQTQTVLQAAYATTSRLEGKTLFDYL